MIQGSGQFIINAVIKVILAWTDLRIFGEKHIQIESKLNTQTQNVFIQLISNKI